MTSRLIPILTVVAAIIAFWYAATVWMNSAWEYDQAERISKPAPTLMQLIPKTMQQERPVLPAPHQVVEEIWKTTVEKKVTSKRSLIYHAWITLSSTTVGFLFGSLLGIVLAAAIIHVKSLEKSMMPWIISSQTIPILAIAPMIIVVLNALGVQGLFPKALISAYLSFFPVTVGMVKGFRSPDTAHLDLMHTYNASAAQIFFKLRWPSAIPFLITSMKVAIAASLIGAIVGEMTLSQDGGVGARLLNGSYYGQTMMIWSALIMAAAMAGTLVALIGVAGQIVNKRMGANP
ncbi:MAG: ABC transporter permease [Pseudomonadota bacterium]